MSQTVFPRLRWIAIVIPTAFLLALEAVTLVVVAPFTAPWVAVLVAAAITLVGVTLFSRLIFAIVEGVQVRLVQRNRQLSALNAVGAVLGQSLEMEDVVSHTLETVLEVTDSKAGIVFVQDEESGRMTPCGARGEGHEALLGLGGGTIEEVADSVVLRTPQDTAEAVAEAARKSGLAHFAIVPLKAKGRPVGMMVMASDHQRELGETEQQWLASMGAQIGVAIENSHLYRAARRRTEQLAALNEASLSLTSELSLGAVLQKVVDLSRQVVQARYGALGVLDEQGRIQEFVTSGISARERRRIGHPPEGKGLLGLIMREGKALRVADISAHPKSAGFPPHHPVMHSLLGLPIVYKGRTIGDLYLADKEGGGEFTQEDQDAVTLFAAQAAVAIEKARLYEEERRRTQEWRSLFELGEQVAASLDLNALLRTVVERAQELLRTESAILTLLSPNRDELTVAASVGLRTEGMRNLRVPVRPTTARFPAEDEGPVIIEDYLTDPRRTTPPIPEILEEHLVSFIAARFAAKGKLLGVLHVANRTPTRFSEHDGRLLQAFANLAAIAVENARLYEQVQSLAVLEERQRIGMDLHDGVIQSIYAVGLNLEECSEEVFNRPREVQARLEKAINDLNQVIKDIRSYIFDLRPHALELANLTDALSTLVRELRVNSLIEANLVVDGARDLGSRLTEEQATNLFHIAQEALANVQKHARASTVEARLTVRNGVLRLAISDDGVGFAPGWDIDPSHRGLRNMAERAQSLGGHFSVESIPGKGTCVVAEIPIGVGREDHDQ
jgi:GAF domain-containing protein/two-component sensor histidine kinase